MVGATVGMFVGMCVGMLVGASVSSSLVIVTPSTSIELRRFAQLMAPLS